jgi:peroxiredoxin
MSSGKELKVGDKAPAFSLKDTNGKTVKLSGPTTTGPIPTYSNVS